MNAASPSAQIKNLARAVSLAFSSSCITPEEAGCPVLKHTDMPWSNPPLLCEATLDGTPLSKYLDVPLDCDGKKLFEFWKSTLNDLYDRKRHLILHGTFSSLNKVLDRASLGQKALRFAIPSGYPAEISEFAGVEFSLEAAHTAMTSVALLDFVSDNENNYYAVLPDGSIIGVQKGKPAVEGTRWDIPAYGMIGEFLTMTRGHGDHTCMYDQIARARSLLWEYKVRFKDWQAVDYSLQALRKLTLGAFCPPLFGAAHTGILDTMVLEAREVALRQSMEVMNTPNLSDRAKVLTIQQALVPLVMTQASFRTKLYNTSGVVPFTIRDQAVTRIQAWLAEEYDLHIPQNMKRR